MILAAALKLLMLTTPDGEPLEVNPSGVISMRAPRRSDAHIVPGTQCILFTYDSKYWAVKESCAEVERQMLDSGHH